MNKTFARRALTSGAIAVAVFGASALPASAHFCFKTNLNERAAAGQAGSANWVPFEVIAFEFTGLCPAGIAVLAEAAGATPDTLINTHGTMAGGTLKKGGGNPAISHLDFAALDSPEVGAEAAAACAP